jgi:phospholipid/cholesterol/gamma-HCH transport system substrate-binding protein
MNHNVVETVLGGVVLLVAAIFLTMAMGAVDVRDVDGYEVKANFAKIDGINPGIDVRISGVKVGSVLETVLDPKTYLATVTMSIKNDIQLPTDTVAKVSSEGLLGGKYMALEPGAEEEMIENGGQIQYTQASLNLEEMIGKFIFSSAEKDKKDDAAADAAAADPYASAE